MNGQNILYTKKAIYVLLVSFIILMSGCIIGSQRIDAPIVEESTPSSSPIGQDIDANMTDLDHAERTFIQLYDALSKKRYEYALTMFDPTLHPDIGWESLEQFTIPEERSNKEKVLEQYCNAVGTCVPGTTIRSSQKDSDTFELIVQYKDIVFTPCCDEQGNALPEQTEFTVIVKKVDNTFKIITPPLYIP
ncbi:MAG TPA: hypothetical protein VJB65_04480 [Patescibacteria group bacterium]|nr:hypothetical protein [Patescibacteria group bacterium]